MFQRETVAPAKTRKVEGGWCILITENTLLGICLVGREEMMVVRARLLTVEMERNQGLQRTVCMSIFR